MHTTLGCQHPLLQADHPLTDHVGDTIPGMATDSVTRGPTGDRVAAAVKSLRDQRGWTMQELAERMESVGRPMGWTTIQKIEKRQRRVDVDDLVALARAFDVHVDVLLTGTDTQNQRALRAIRDEMVNLPALMDNLRRFGLDDQQVDAMLRVMTMHLRNL